MSNHTPHDSIVYLGHRVFDLLDALDELPDEHGVWDNDYEPDYERAARIVRSFYEAVRTEFHAHSGGEMLTYSDGRPVETTEQRPQMFNGEPTIVDYAHLHHPATSTDHRSSR